MTKNKPIEFELPKDMTKNKKFKDRDEIRKYFHKFRKPTCSIQLTLDETGSKIKITKIVQLSPTRKVLMK